MQISHGSVSKESDHQALTAANLRALEPNLSEQHEVLGRFVGGSNSLIDRAHLHSLFRANGVIGEIPPDPTVGALSTQPVAADTVGRVGAVPLIGQAQPFFSAELDGKASGVGRLSSEFDYPTAIPDSHWLSQATNISGVDSIGNGVMSPTAEELISDSQLNTSQPPMSPTRRGKAASDVGVSFDKAVPMAFPSQRPKCGRASSEFNRPPMVGQIVGQAQAQMLPQGMIGGLPLGGMGQIPENAAGHMGATQVAATNAGGPYMRNMQPRFSAPVSRLIGPLPQQSPLYGPQQQSSVYASQLPAATGRGHVVGQVGQYPAIASLPAGAIAGYPAGVGYGHQQQQQPPHSSVDERLRRFSAPAVQGTAAQRMQDARQLLATRNSQSMNAAQMQAHVLPQVTNGTTTLGHIGQLPQAYSQLSLSQAESAGSHSLTVSQVEHLQHYYNALQMQQQQQHHQQHQQHLQHQQPNGHSFAAYMPQHLQPPSSNMPGMPSGEGNSKSHSEQSKLSKPPSNDAASVALASELSEAHVLPSISSMDGRPSTKVRVVCSSNGTFVKQPSGNFEYLGGETRLVSIASSSNLQSLKEALDRVVAKASSTSASGSPESMFLKYRLPSDPNVYVDLLDDVDVQLMFDEWADFATQHKDTACKLHVYVAWGKAPGSHFEEVDGAKLSNGSAVSSEELAPSPEVQKDDLQIKEMAGRMEIISPHEISLAKFLGSGGYGEVYLGRWHSCEVAIKCLNPSLFFSGSDGKASKAAMADLLREADVLAGLRHPNVVWVYGVVLPKLETDESGNLLLAEDLDPIPMASGANLGRCCNLRPPAVVTEFMSQGSVKSALARKSDVVVGNMHRVIVAMDAAKGMEYLHQKRIVHFDLKSANLLLGYRDRRAVCKVADFGLSKQKRDTYVSNVTSQRGTLPWIAPEIIKTPHAVTEKVDVYSFGVVLWELWTGREPYEGLNYHALLHQITITNGTLRPTLPTSPEWDRDPCPEPAPGWASLIERCWQEHPEHRPSFDEIVRELKAMGQALRPPRNRPKSSAGASVSSAELDARGVPSGKPRNASPAQQLAQQAAFGGMESQTTTRLNKDSHRGPSPSARSGWPPIGVSEPAKQAADAAADNPGLAAAALQPPPAADAAAGGPGEEHNIATVTRKLSSASIGELTAAHNGQVQQPQLGAAMGGGGGGGFQVASAFQAAQAQNPFSSAFAYTERMNSAFTSG